MESHLKRKLFVPASISDTCNIGAKTKGSAAFIHSSLRKSGGMSLKTITCTDNFPQAAVGVATPSGS